MKWIVIWTHLMGNPFSYGPGAPVFYTAEACYIYVQKLNGPYPGVWRYDCLAVPQ